MRVLALANAALLASGPAASAQNLTGFLTGLRTAAGADTSAEPPAAEQADWAAQQRAEATARWEELQSPEGQARLEREGWGPAEREELLHAARELAETWAGAVGILQSVLLREKLASSPPPPTPSPPTTAAEAGELEQRAAGLQMRIAEFEAQRAALEELLAQARQRARTHQAAAQAAAMELEAEGADPSRQAAARVRLELGRTREALARAQIFSLQWRLYRDELEKQSAQAELASLREALDASPFGRLLSPQRAAEHLAALEHKMPALERQLAEAEQRLAELSQQVEQWRREDTPAARQRLQAALPDLELRETFHRLARWRAAGARLATTLWKRAAQAAESPSLAALDRARQDTAADLRTLETARAQLDHTLGELRRQIEAAEAQAASPGLAERARIALRQRLEALRQAQEQALGLSAEAAALQETLHRLHAELSHDIAQLESQRAFHALLHRAQQTASRIWKTQLFDAGGRPLNLGTLTVAALTLALGLWLARLAASRLARAAIARFRAGPSHAHLLEKLALYSLATLFSLLVLQWLNIPLTVFAFLGGALAVGIGFGSQNLINNFISGLLLLLERKINVGDLIEVDGKAGRVTSLGTRCATIRLFDGVEVLVPNSSLLEKNVVNWTLSDPLHRYELRAGFAYDSNVELIFATIEEALREQTDILRDPAPGIYFQNFGESALEFLVLYWLRVGSSNPLEVGSALRRSLHRLCGERGIVMAYPQRDIHLTSPQPLRVRMIR